MAGNRWQRTLGYETDQAGAEIGSLRLQVTALQDTAVKITGTPITIPEIDSSFTPTFRRDTKKKSGVYVTLAFLIPAETAVLTVKMVRTADRTTSTTFKQSKFSYDVEDITDEERSVQRVVRELYTKGNPLDYETQYDVFRLAAFATAKADSPSVLGENPQVDVLFNDPPLLTFTTPVAFGLPSNPNAALIMANALDGSTRAFDAYTTFRQHAPLTDAGAAQTYAAANVNEAYFEINDPDGKPHKIGGVLNDTELSQVDAGSTPANRGYFERTLYKEYPGGAYSWVRNIAWANGQKKQSTGSAVNYNAAGFSTDPTTLTGVSLTIVTNVDPYTSKFGRIDLVYTQPSTRVGLKNVTVERKRSADSDSTYQVIVKKFSLKDDEYTTTGAHTVVICEGVGFKPSIAYTLRVTIHAIGGATYQFTQTVTTGSNPDVAVDTAIPTLATNPDTGTTGATVQERHSKIDVSCPLPSANINTLDNYQVVLSTSSSAPAGTPTVGSEGVVVIKYGQNPSFNLSYFADLATDFYVYFRAHNTVGYSLWSAGTTQHGYSRPIQDFIGNGVPTLPIRLERSGTSGTGHGSSTFVLESGASSTDDYYNNMHLHVTGGSPAAADRVRKITDYVGSTRTCTLDTAWGSTPSGNLAYEIHAGLELGEKSGTATGSTSTVKLGSSASSVDDTYNGMMIYLPAAASADKIRKVSDYVGATKVATLESALSGAISTGDCYMISKGSFGYAAINPLSGIITGVPFRIWFDDDTNFDVIEVIMPTGENAFSIQAIQIKGYKAGTGTERINLKQNVTVTPTYSIPAPGGYQPIFRLRLQNLYRDGGSDGWSSYTYYVEGYDSAAAPAQPYNPAVYIPVEVDFQDTDSYPTTRYPTY